MNDLQTGKIIDFYSGLCGNQNGDTLEDMLKWHDGRLEMDHDYVQWMFPSNEPSSLNGESPTMTLDQSSPELQGRVKHSFVRFLAFLGFKLSRDDEIIEIEALDGQTPWWIRYFNHNMLRVTRVLKCLRLTGNSKYAVAFYNALRPYCDESEVSVNTTKHWKSAIFDPLW